MGNIHKVFGVFLMVGIIFFILITLELKNFFHLDALLLVLVGTFGYTIANYHNESIFKNIGDGAVYFGWLGVMIAGITIASNAFMGNKSEDLGPAIAMMLHPLFYGYVMRLITKVL